MKIRQGPDLAGYSASAPQLHGSGSEGTLLRHCDLSRIIGGRGYVVCVVCFVYFVGSGAVGGGILGQRSRLGLGLRDGVAGVS